MGVDAEGYWTVNGTRVTDAGGQHVKASGKDGDSFFSNVSQDENSVTFTLANGTVIVIPKAGTLEITTNVEHILYLKYGDTGTYTLTLSGTGSVIITKPDGWRVTLQDEKLTITAPPLTNTFAEKDGNISITAVGNNITVNKTFAVSARDYNYVIDFEDSRVADYLAGPTSYGDNLYSGYSGSDPGRYYGYDDQGSELFMMINDPDNTSDPDFWSGGIAISQWNDMTTAVYTNQCSVYYSDPVTGKGGYKGSNTFAVHFGYQDYGSYNDGRTYITFMDNTKECVFDHFYVINNTYAMLSMKNGDSFARAHTYENKLWYKLVVEGIGKDGSITGTVECYLSDFRTSTSPGILTEWTPVDLSPLGKVTAIRFNVQGNDDNGYGLATPAYFCFDNLAIKQ
jgi:hypothetical protein